MKTMLRFYSPLISDVADSLGIHVGVLPMEIRPILPDPTVKFCGPAFPCRVVPTDEYVEIDTILEMVDAIPDGAVVLVAADAPIEAALWGGLMSTRSYARGAVGAVTNGPVRDIAQIASLGFPVYATGACMRDIRRRGYMHSFGVPVTIGDVAIAPGDIVFADANGVIVIPQNDFPTILAELERALGEEARVHDGLMKGGDAVDMFKEHGRF